THHRLVVTHGNGPQVGLLALQSASDPDTPAPPLDVLDAESVGLIGYLLVQALSRFLDPALVAAVLTRVVVEADDPAFHHPTKPVGPWYRHGRAQRLAEENGWHLVEGEQGFRRVVPSPEPQQIVELEAIEVLLEADRVVVAGGGGGIPVAVIGDQLVGVEAVVDKDLTSALLAQALGADRLIVLTDVDAVYLDHGEPSARPIVDTTPAELRRFRFAPGSMGPKIEAVCRFVETTGAEASIGALQDADAVLAGDAGTTIHR
ncbi:MAG: carbamate kinase, partial [Acidimicrobiia bacterium]|nr:carbamate kinase [Acidimicrobiia bacterium]